MRKTYALVQVAIAMMNDPTGRYWGYDLSRKAGIRSGVLYPMLTRMLDEGWLADGWEEHTPHRPPRRYYELTNEGRMALEGMLTDARRDARFRGLVS